MTLLIKNVQPLGSARELPPRTDIFISGDKISAFGNFSSKGADETIDGQGAYASPGFIDIDTDSDHYLTLFDDPSQEDFLKQGVTTIIGGQCGSSLAPLIYGSLESIRKWTDIGKMNVGWNSVKEYLTMLEKLKLGVNFGTMIGHSTIRRSIIGESQRALTKNELGVFSEILKRSLAEGGLGLSTGLGYLHGRNTPYQEIKTLLKAVKSFNGVYATHLRKGGEGLSESVGETLKIFNETGVKTLISHFMPRLGEEKGYEKALEELGRLPANKDFHFDVYPFDSTIVPLYTFLPEWAQRENLEMMNLLIQDEWQSSKILKELPAVAPENFLVSRATKNEAVVGHSLKELKTIYGTNDSKKALLQLMITTKLQAVVFHKNISERLIKSAISHPRSLIASNAASSHEKSSDKALKPERATSTFTKFLSMAENENLMPLEDAIKKITLVPAKKFGLHGRGELKEGNFADLAIFKNNEIKFVIVNGKTAVKEGIFQGTRAGKVLRRYDG
ncbi:MAG: amidohydrolase family protein [Patescibacteria group bacterium]